MMSMVIVDLHNMPSTLRLGGVDAESHIFGLLSRMGMQRGLKTLALFTSVTSVVARYLSQDC